MNDFDTGWLVGFLEGEGCFMAGPPSNPRSTMLVAVTTDRDVAESAARLLGCAVNVRAPKQPHHKEQYVVQRSGKEARRLMRELRPYMSKRRQDAIDKALASYVPPMKPLGGQTLTFDQADEVRALLAQGLGPTEVGRRFKVSRDVIRAVRRGYRRPEA